MGILLEGVKVLESNPTVCTSISVAGTWESSHAVHGAGGHNPVRGWWVYRAGESQFGPRSQVREHRSPGRQQCHAASILYN